MFVQVPSSKKRWPAPPRAPHYEYRPMDRRNPYAAHNQSKGDAGGPVDNHVTATIPRRTATALLDVPIAMQRGGASEI